MSTYLIVSNQIEQMREEEINEASNIYAKRNFDRTCSFPIEFQCLIFDPTLVNHPTTVLFPYPLFLARGKITNPGLSLPTLIDWIGEYLQVIELCNDHFSK